MPELGLAEQAVARLAVVPEEAQAPQQAPDRVAEEAVAILSRRKIRTALA